MKKLLILLAFFGFLLPIQNADAQCGFLGCGYGSGNYWALANYTYFWNNSDKYQRTAFVIDQAFGAIFSSIALIERGQRVEKQIMARRSALENYKSVKRYYTEGIPPFASHGPDGRPRSPKITWQDVESID